MDDFVQVMKDWRRMCKSYSTDDDLCCENCSLRNIVDHGCGAIFEDEFADVVDWAELKRRVETWAAEHPEPVYPTWYEWLNQIGVLRLGVLGTGPTGAKYVGERMCTMHIPAEIAQKLGIEPKEG